MADPVPNLFILLRQTSGVRKKGKGEKEQKNLYISKGELLAEIFKKEQVKQEEGTPHHNYCLLRDPDITLYDSGTNVSPLIGPEGDYLEGIKEPVTRLVEYQKEGHLQWIMDLQHGEEVFFRLKREKGSQASVYPRGRVRYYGRVEGEKGVIFGIEITDPAYRGKGTTNGYPYFKCADRDGVFVSMDKIIKPVDDGTVPNKEDDNITHINKQPRGRPPAYGTHTQHKGEKKEGFLHKAGKVLSYLGGGGGQESPVDPPTRPVVLPSEFKFSVGDRVVVQTVRGKAVTGTVRWVGSIKAAGNIAVPAVGIETDRHIFPDQDFPGIHLDLTGSHGQHRFNISDGHSRLYLPEAMVLKAEEYTKQKQEDSMLEARDTMKWGMSVDEYRGQMEMKIKAGAHQPQELSLYPSGGDPAQPAAPNDPSNFTLGTMVQIESHEGRLLYGTIRWMGTLQGYDGYYAGVELDYPMERCSNGSFDGVQYFDCPPGRGLFCLSIALQPDRRYHDVNQVPSDKRQDNKNPTTDSESVVADINCIITREERKEQREECLEELLISMEKEMRQLKEDKESLSSNFKQLIELSKRLSALYQERGLVIQEEKKRNSQLLEQVARQQSQISELQSSIEDIQQKNTVLAEENNTIRSRREEIVKEVSELKEALDQQENKYQWEREEHQKIRNEKAQLEEIAQQFEKSWKVTHEDLNLTKKELGRGAWGAVRVGVFREQRVAVKELHMIIAGEHSLALLNREINTMSKLRHPNLLLFIGAVLDHPSGHPLIITEIMDTSLQQAYEKGQLTDKSTKLSVLRDTAAGLNYLRCHPDETIHRDVSSANVLLESRGPNKWRAKLSDFGSANVATKAFTQGMGTLVYSAPESIPDILGTNKQQLTTKMDVFSYGVLLCEVLTSSFPDADQFQTMLRSVSRSSPTIGQLVQDCINRNPKERPTMKQVIQQIDQQLK